MRVGRGDESRAGARTSEGGHAETRRGDAAEPLPAGPPRPLFTTGCSRSQAAHRLLSPTGRSRPQTAIARRPLSPAGRNRPPRGRPPKRATFDVGAAQRGERLYASESLFFPSAAVKVFCTRLFSFPTALSPPLSLSLSLSLLGCRRHDVPALCSGAIAAAESRRRNVVRTRAAWRIQLTRPPRTHRHRCCAHRAQQQRPDVFRNAKKKTRHATRCCLCEVGSTNLGASGSSPPPRRRGHDVRCGPRQRPPPPKGRSRL